MLIKILLSYILGYVTVTIEGYYIERFINICKSKKIAIWNLKRNKEVSLTFRTQVKEFKNVCKIAKKVQCKIRIENKKGLPFFLNKYKKRKIFAILLVLIAFLVIFSSNFVWNVDIREENGKKT